MQPDFPIREETQKTLKILFPVVTMHGSTDAFSSSAP